MVSIGAVGKLILGLVFLAAGLWTLLPLQGFLGAVPYLGSFAGAGSGEFLLILKGSIPLLLVFFGIVLVWIELDEIRLSGNKKPEIPPSSELPEGTE